jgi:hypothetical protein
MPKPTKIALAVLLVAAVGGFLVWQVLRDQEPVYQGKPLSVWLRDFKGNPQLTTAVRQIGTNGIPALLRMLARKDSPLASKPVVFWNRHVWSLQRWLRDPRWYHIGAVHANTDGQLGFEILGTNAQQAAPALIAIYERNISRDSQTATSRALNAIGPVAQRMAIPSYLRAAASSNTPVREVAVWALSGVQVEPQLVVPALAKFLSDTNWVSRTVAANGLGRLGTNAQQAVPALVPRLTDLNPRVRRGATNALKLIDPEAAARAGVK